MSKLPVLILLLPFALLLGCPVNIDKPVGDDDTGDDDTGDDDTGDDDTGDDDTGDDDTGDDDTGDDDVGDDDSGDDDTSPYHPAEGRDFLRDLTNANWTAPPGVGNILAQYMGDIPMIMHVVAIDDVGGEIWMYGGTVDGPGPQYVQDLCIPTYSYTDAQPGVWNDPAYSVGPVDLHHVYDGSPGTTFGFTADGTIAPDGLSMAGGTVAGAIDTRFLDPLIDPSADPGAACELLTSLGISCQACPGGVGPYCLDFAASDVTAAEVSVTGTNPETGQTYNTLTEVDLAQVQTWRQAGHCP